VRAEVTSELVYEILKQMPLGAAALKDEQCPELVEVPG
jgi:hypothetical protein